MAGVPAPIELAGTVPFEEHAVLDGGAAGRRGAPGALDAVGMDRGAQAERLRLAARRVELRLAEGGTATQPDALGGEDLDHVRPLRLALAHVGAQLFRRALRILQRCQRGEDARAGDGAAGDRVAHLGVERRAEALHGGDAALQGGEPVLHRVEDGAGRRLRLFVRQPAGLVEVPGEMDVGVDAAGQQGEGAQVPGGRCGASRPDRLDPVTLGERWIVVAGLRHDRATSEPAPGTQEKTSATSKRLGLMHRWGNGWAPYLSYSESFTPVANIGAQSFDPLRGRQWEAGVKYEPPGGDGLAFSALVYDLKERNGVVEVTPNVYAQLNETWARGVELETSGRLSPAIDLLASAPARRRWFDLDDPALRATLAAGPRLIHWVARCDDVAAECAALAAADPRVRTVLYPGLPEHPGHDVVRQPETGHGAGVRGGAEPAFYPR